MFDASAGDAHAGLQGAKLFQALPPLQRRLRQRDETRQRRAAEGVDADMVPARPVAPRDRHAREIQRRRHRAAAVERARRLHHRRQRSPPRPYRSAPPAWRCRTPGRPAASARCADRPAECSAGRPAGSPPRRAGPADRAPPAPRAPGPSRAAASGSVSTAMPPLARTASAISASPQATATGPISASRARSSTCTIIGRPWMSASGLPGSRVDAMRDGMTTIGFTGVRQTGWVDG